MSRGGLILCKIKATGECVILIHYALNSRAYTRMDAEEKTKDLEADGKTKGGATGEGKCDDTHAEECARPAKESALGGSHILIGGCLLCIAAIAAMLVMWPVGHGAATPPETVSGAPGAINQSNMTGAAGNSSAPEGNLSAPHGNLSGYVPGFEITFTTDKRSYGSSQTMNLTAKVISPAKADDLEVWFFGIKNKYNANKVSLKVNPKLVPGENTVSANAVLPRCYGCSGIKPGNYTLYAGVYTKGNIQLANATSWIMMVQ